MSEDDREMSAQARIGIARLEARATGNENLFSAFERKIDERYREISARITRMEVAGIAVLVTIAGFVVRAVLSGVVLQ